MASRSKQTVDTINQQSFHPDPPRNVSTTEKWHKPGFQASENDRAPGKKSVYTKPLDTYHGATQQMLPEAMGSPCRVRPAMNCDTLDQNTIASNTVPAMRLLAQLSIPSMSRAQSMIHRKSILDCLPITVPWIAKTLQLVAPAVIKVQWAQRILLPSLLRRWLVSGLR